MEMEEREKICLEVLRELPPGDYILIGGYASSSFGFPRFSVDLDLVIDKEEKKVIQGILEERKFSPVEGELEPVVDMYGGKFERFEKQANDLKVSVDLLIDSLISHQTGSSYSFDYLFENSKIREVSGYSSDLKVKARVANREMLIALKANSMRLADQRDIITLCNQEVNIEKTVKHLKRCPKEIIMKNIDGFLETLQSEKHKDSIKGVFSISDSTYEKITKSAEKVFHQVKEGLKY